MTTKNVREAAAIIGESASHRRALETPSTTTDVMVEAVRGTLDVAPAFERAPQRHFVRVLKVAADRQAARDPCDAHVERPDEAGQIDRRRLAFDRGVRAEDDLFDLAGSHTLQQ